MGNDVQFCHVIWKSFVCLVRPSDTVQSVLAAVESFSCASDDYIDVVLEAEHS